MISETMKFILLVIMGTTMVATLSFPVLFSRYRWRRTPIGRALMVKASSTALAVSVTFLMTALHVPVDIQYMIYAIAFSAIGLSSAGLTYAMLTVNDPKWGARYQKTTERGFGMKLSSKTYDALKFVAQILLPALGTLYFALSQIWGLPKGAEVVGTITVIDTFLGALLSLSTNTFNKTGAAFDGTINVVDTPDKTQFQLAVDTAPEKLAQQDKVVLKVTNDVLVPTSGPKHLADEDGV